MTAATTRRGLVFHLSVAFLAISSLSCPYILSANPEKCFSEASSELKKIEPAGIESGHQQQHQLERSSESTERAKEKKSKNDVDPIMLLLEEVARLKLELIPSDGPAKPKANDQPSHTSKRDRRKFIPATGEQRKASRSTDCFKTPGHRLTCWSQQQQRTNLQDVDNNNQSNNQTNNNNRAEDSQARARAGTTMATMTTPSTSRESDLLELDNDDLLETVELIRLQGLLDRLSKRGNFGPIAT